MIKGKFNLTVDGMWGSCAKGHTATALAAKYRPEILSTTNGPGAGHTAVNIDGTKFVAKAIPSPAILNKWLPEYHPHIVLGGTASFDITRLMDEVQQCGVNYSLSIHPRAGVITDEHRRTESGDGELSTKHIASTMQGGGACLAEKVMRKSGIKLARDYPELTGLISDSIARKLNITTSDQEKLVELSFPEILHSLMEQHGYTILHEGAQGFSLDITHGSHYPQCTARGTTSTQIMADMGISPRDVGDIYLVIRPYPIRVGSLVVDGKQIGYSGDCYSDQHEMSWQDVADNAGMPQDVASSLLKTELTTVTKRLRRVFSFSETQLRQAALVNGATKIALNFANYIDYSVFGVNDYDKLTPKVKDFIRKVEDITKVPVTIVGTGPQLDHVVML